MSGVADLSTGLYGRFTEKIDLRQLGFAAAQEFFPESYTPEDRIHRCHSLAGGNHTQSASGRLGAR
ncbi:hypothetical protein C9J85_10485 [Haloferax sp. wsp5]|nr:hypothetical protein C9J85_10485 [Haloferax sp. wsp5]